MKRTFCSVLGNGVLAHDTTIKPLRFNEPGIHAHHAEFRLYPSKPTRHCDTCTCLRYILGQNCRAFSWQIFLTHSFCSRPQYRETSSIDSPLCKHKTKMGEWRCRAHLRAARDKCTAEARIQTSPAHSQQHMQHKCKSHAKCQQPPTNCSIWEYLHTAQPCSRYAMSMKVDTARA